MDENRRSILDMLRLNRRFVFLFLSLFFFQLEALTPSLYLVLAKKPVPAWVQTLSLVAGALLCVFFLILYLQKEEKTDFASLLRVYPGCLLHALLLFVLGVLLYAVLFGRLSPAAVLASIKSKGAWPLIGISLLALSALYMTLLFLMIYLNKAVKSNASFMESGSVYLESVKDFFKKIYLSLPLSILLGILGSLAIALIVWLSGLKAKYLNGDLLSLGIFYVLETYILSYLFHVFFNLTSLYGFEEKERKAGLPVWLIVLAILCSVLYVLATPKMRYTTVDNILYDASIHQSYGDIYLDGGDYHNAMYEYRIAQSEIEATRVYVDGLIAVKNGSAADEAPKKIEEIRELCPNNAFINLMRARAFLLVGDIDNAIRELETSLYSLQANEAQYGTLLKAYALKRENEDSEQLEKKAKDLISVMMDKSYYSDTYSDLEKLALNRLYAYKTSLEERAKEITESDNYYHAYAYDLMAFGNESSNDLISDGRKVLKTWVDEKDSMDAHYHFSKIASQFAYEGQTYEQAAKSALRLAELYQPQDAEEKAALEYYVASVLVECNQWLLCENYAADKVGDDHKLALFYIYSLYNQSKFQKAIEESAKLLEKDAEDAEALFLHALSLYGDNQEQASMDDMKKMAGWLLEEKDEQRRNYLDDCIYMYCIRTNSRSFQHANEYANYGLSENELLTLYFKAYFQNDRFELEGFRETERKINAIRNDLYTIHYLSGMLYYGNDQNEEAVTEYEKALALRDTAEIHFHLGFAYKNLGKYGRAIREFNIVRSERPSTNHQNNDDHGYAPHSAIQVEQLREHLGEVE